MISKTRNALYKTAKVLGDVNAVLRGTIIQRAVWRIIWSFTGALLIRIVSGIVRAMFKR